MTVYDIATMLAGQFQLVLFQNTKVPKGRILVTPEGKTAGVYINAKDAPQHKCR